MENTVKEKTFYIFIFFTKTKEKEISFKFESKNTEIIYSSIKNINGVFRYNTVIKYLFSPKDSSEKVDLSFYNKREMFTIGFTANKNIFIFNPTLKIKINQTANEKEISQKQVIKITDKIDIFAQCLEKKKENSKFGTLYSDSVDIFETNPDFELLIYLFIKLCGDENIFKDICIKLLDCFWDKKPLELINNQNESCKQYLDNMNKILSKSEKFNIRKWF